MGAPRYAIVKFLDGEDRKWADLVPDICAHFRSKTSAATSKKRIYLLDGFSEYVGNRMLSEITPPFLTRWRDELLTKNLPNTVHAKLEVVSLAMDFVVASGHIPANPMFFVKKPSLRSTGRALTDEQIKLFLNAIPKPFVPICKLGLLTGMRISEAVSLEWWQVKKDHIIIPREKAKWGRARAIEIGDAVHDLLGPPGDGRVFRFSAQKLKVNITATWRKLGLGRIRFHDLRHTASDRYPEGDIPGKLANFGWASIQSASWYDHVKVANRGGMLKLRYRF